MKYVVLHTERPPLKPNEERLNALRAWLQKEITDAKAARWMWDSLCRDLLRMYEGVPQNPVRNTPIENAPNIEITLGAIASDAIYAQSMDLIYTVSPHLTVRATNKKWTQHA